MLTKSISMDLFLEQLLAIAKSVIVKRNERADAFETVDTIKAAEKYITAIEMGTEWSSYVIFNYSVLISAGLSKDLVNDIMANGKDLIPLETRDLVCRLQKELIISEYVEKNNYYRMLNGEPDIEDMEKGAFVYAPANPYGIPTDVPIHELNEGQIEYYNSSGMREELFKLYPTKRYLLHQGAYKISYYKARTARNYELLYMNRAENDSVTLEFLRQYNAARDYVMMGLYTKEDQRLYDHYDAFMGFVIMAMTLQRTISCVYQQGITRDFFDNDFIKHLFDAYNIPYIDTIDIPYQKLIAKKLNILLQKKSSDAVLFDITDLFDYNSVDIYRYYLVKDYKKDENGDPIIIYRKVVDEEGNVKEVIDHEKTFDIYFQKVNIKSKDPAVEIANQSNRVPYNSITGEDPYWLNDSDLINKIYNNEFNSILTKYLCIDISYELAKMIYETTHLVRMIIDDQADFKEIKINIPYVSEPVSLFDTILFLCALSAKKIGMAGSCPLQGYQIAQVYGFNFKQDIDLIREQIVHDVESCTGFYKEVNLELLDYLTPLNATTLQGAREMFENIEALRVWLDTAMRYSNNIVQYRAYQKLYKAVLIVEDVKELYTKSDGTFASTFAELLADRRPDLKEVLDQTDANIKTAFDDPTSGEMETNFSINNKINRVLLELSKISKELNDIKYSNDKSAIVANIEKVINQMKSYTVDQTASSILYLIKDPHITMLKTIDCLIAETRDKVLRDKLNILYGDILHQIIIYSKQKEKVDLEEWIWNQKLVLLKDFIHLIHEIEVSYKEERLKDIPIVIDDHLHESYIKTSPLEDILFISENGLFRIKEIVKDYISLNHQELVQLYLAATMDEDIVEIEDSEYKVKDLYLVQALNIIEKLITEVKVSFKEYIRLKEKIQEDKKDSYIEAKLEIYDYIINWLEKRVCDKIIIKTELLKEYYSKPDDYIHIKDEEFHSMEFKWKTQLAMLDNQILDFIQKDINEELTVNEKCIIERYIEFRDILTLVEKMNTKKRLDEKEIFELIDGISSHNVRTEYEFLGVKNDGIFIIRRKYYRSMVLRDTFNFSKDGFFKHSMGVIDTVNNIKEYSINALITLDKVSPEQANNQKFIKFDYYSPIATRDTFNFSKDKSAKHSMGVIDTTNYTKEVPINESIVLDKVSPEQASNQKFIKSDYYVKNALADDDLVHLEKHFSHRIGLKETIRKIYEEV